MTGDKKKNWQLTEAAFELFLNALDAHDRERAGAEYEKIRTRLIRIFEWRGVDAPEKFADDALNRVARKISEGIEIQDISKFIGGVARNVLFEFFDERERLQKKLEAFAEIKNQSANEEDFRVPCFQKCLNALPEEQSNLLIEYYDQTDTPKIEQRRNLAVGFGESANALRIRVHRIRQELDKCMLDCLKRVK